MIRQRDSAILFLFIGFLISCQTETRIQSRKPNPPGINPMASAVKFYRGPLNHLSAVRWGECPMYPSDSEYSLKSMEKHGWLLGWIMAADRLMRCGRDETVVSQKVRIQGKWKTYDPVENNDFWWKKTPPRE